MSMGRRGFLKTSLALAAAGAGGALYVRCIEPNWLREKHYDLATPKWPKDMPPLTIAFAADLHVGCPSVTLERLEEIAGRLNAMKADIILLGGDYVVGPHHPVGDYIPPGPIAAVLERLKAPGGVHAVLGNHDWGRDGHGLWRAFEKAGIQVHENSAAPVMGLGQKFWIAGLADDTTRIPRTGRTLSQVKDDSPVILLTHDPATFMETSARPVVTLAGHTHGGQVYLPGVGPLARPAGRCPVRYFYGHIVEEGCDLIVTGGIGTSNLPVRFGVPPEIVRLTIRPSIS